ncbi:MAG: hypothetical protein LQ346_006598 [Caloplaca aetnensis]|nr:MAG: hypothetical protein LQ346_006598 [Caloplaca aetnensis]
MPPSRDSRPTATGSTFLRLPLEIRQQIYHLALPSQDVPLRSRNWANIIGTPNQSMNLLTVNKQVFDEARQILYGSTAFSIIISPTATKFLRSVEDSVWFRPLPPMPSIRCIKNWQIGLQLPGSLRSWRVPYVQEGILAASAELSQIPNLQTLKISFPCLCGQDEDLPVEAVDIIHRRMNNILRPLRHLRTHGKATFIAANRRLPWNDELDAWHARNPQPTGHNEPGAWNAWFNRMPQCWYPTKDEYIQWAAQASANIQCDEPRCLRFTARFNDIAATLEGGSAPVPLAPWQIDWLQLKKNVSERIPGHNWQAQIYILTPPWEARAWASKAKWAVIIERANALLRIHVHLLHGTGRFDDFRYFAQIGMPENEWEEKFSVLEEREHEPGEMKDASSYWYVGEVAPGDEHFGYEHEVEKLVMLSRDLLRYASPPKY